MFETEMLASSIDCANDLTVARLHACMQACKGDVHGLAGNFINSCSAVSVHTKLTPQKGSVQIVAYGYNSLALERIFCAMFAEGGERRHYLCLDDKTSHRLTYVDRNLGLLAKNNIYLQPLQTEPEELGYFSRRFALADELRGSIEDQIIQLHQSGQPCVLWLPINIPGYTCSDAASPDLIDDFAQSLANAELPIDLVVLGFDLLSNHHEHVRNDTVREKLLDNCLGDYVQGLVRGYNI